MVSVRLLKILDTPSRFAELCANLPNYTGCSFGFQHPSLCGLDLDVAMMMSRWTALMHNGMELMRIACMMEVVGRSVDWPVGLR